MNDFEYFEPTSINEVIFLLSKYKDKAKVIAGGSNLLVKMKQGEESPQYVISLGSISGLDYIDYDAHEGLRLGALVTIRALEQSPELRQRYPVISQAAGQLGNVAIRNMATLGGNLCSALPSADTALVLIGLSARAKVVGANGERLIPLEDFFTGLGRTALDGQEILVEIQVPVLLANTRGVYFRYAVRAEQLPLVGGAVVATVEPNTKTCRDIKIVLGNVAPTPIRARKAEEVIRGKKVDETLINRAAQIASSEVRARRVSMRASPEYKKEIVRVFTRRAIMEVTAQMSQGQ